MKICILSQQHFHNKHVSEMSIDGFEKAVLQNTDAEVMKIEISEMIWKINRTFKTKLVDFKLLSKVKRYRPDYIVLAAMGSGALAYQLPTLKRIHIPQCVYCFDTWKTNMRNWKRCIQDGRIEYVMCAYRGSIPDFSAICKKVGFLPQSMNEAYFYPRQTDKTHLFMQIGRKNAMLDAFIKQYLEDKNLSDDLYIRERVKGEIIYPDFDQLGQEINKTFFFVVSPRNIDESNITGNISDVTARFYEGMACKTMLIGIKPKDTFDILFPNPNAMIEVATYQEFRDKVDFFLEHPDAYQAVVEENYRHVMSNHTWCHRATALIDFLKNIDQ